MGARLKWWNTIIGIGGGGSGSRTCGCMRRIRLRSRCMITFGVGSEYSIGCRLNRAIDMRKKSLNESLGQYS